MEGIMGGLTIEIVAALFGLLGIVGGFGVSWGMVVAKLTRLESDSASMAHDTASLRRHVDRSLAVAQGIGVEIEDVARRVESIDKATCDVIIRVEALERAGGQQ
jgi:hypothetical protein